MSITDIEGKVLMAFLFSLDLLKLAPWIGFLTLTLDEAVDFVG